VKHANTPGKARDAGTKKPFSPATIALRPDFRHEVTQMSRCDYLIGFRLKFAQNAMRFLAQEVGAILVSKFDIISCVGKHQRVLEAIFEKRANIAWADVESMLLPYGAEISEGRGSRVRIALNGARAVFHRPHPKKETDRGAVASLQRFLAEAGIRMEK
jgi:hypothetical protein